MPLLGCKASTVDDHIAYVRVVGPWSCWKLPNKPKSNGYVEIRINYKLGYAHRAVYKKLIGPIPRKKPCLSG